MGNVRAFMPVFLVTLHHFIYGVFNFSTCSTAEGKKYSRFLHVVGSLYSHTFFPSSLHIFVSPVFGTSHLSLVSHYPLSLWFGSIVLHPISPQLSHLFLFLPTFLHFQNSVSIVHPGFFPNSFCSCDNNKTNSSNKLFQFHKADIHWIDTYTT